MDFFSDVFSAALKITKKNVKIVVVLVLIIGLLFPIIDSLLIKPTQIEQEISVLNKIHDLEEIEFTTPLEQQLKKDIELKVEKYIENNQVSINLKQRYFEDPWKFYSGISIWLYVLITLLFQKMKWTRKISTIIMVLIFIIVIGTIGLLLPTVGSPWVNYFLYPILQIIFIVSSLDLKPKKKKM